MSPHISLVNETLNFSTQVLDVNEAPTAVTLNPSEIKENSAHGTWIGNITVVDPDNERNPDKQTHTCSANLQGLPFSLQKNQLFVSNCTKCQQLDFETSTKLTVVTVCKDSGFPAKSRTELLTVDITDVNEPPTGLRLSNDKVPENNKDRHVGIFYGIDPDKRFNQNLTYELLVGKADFYLQGDQLLTKTQLDYERNQTHKIKVKVSDYKGLNRFMFCFLQSTLICSVGKNQYWVLDFKMFCDSRHVHSIFEEFRKNIS